MAEKLVDVTILRPGMGWQMLTWRTFALITAMGLAVLTGWAVITQAGAPTEAGIMAGIFILAGLLWVTEALPLFATSLLVVGLMAILLANPGQWEGLGFDNGQEPSFREVIACVADPVLLLFFGGFVLAHAAVATGVDQAMSTVLLRPFGTRPRWVLLGLMLVTLCFGMWMSNTATTAMMLAILTPILAVLPREEPLRKALVLSVPLTANISGMCTPIASPPNAVAVGYLTGEGYQISFLRWMLVAVPLALFLVFLGWVLLYRLFPPTVGEVRLPSVRRSLSWRGWFVVVIFLMSALLWMTDMLHGLPAAGVALLPIVALTTSGIFTRDDLKQIDWSVLILIAGGIALGWGMQTTGLDRLIAGWIPQSTGPQVLLGILVLATVATGTFMSNTAAANLFLPIGLSAAVASGAITQPDTHAAVDAVTHAATATSHGLHPILAAVSIALAASMSMALPVSTPPNAMAYAKGEFTSRELSTVMLTVSVIAIAAIIFGGPWIMRLCGMIPWE